MNVPIDIIGRTTGDATSLKERLSENLIRVERG